jgi:hypothetical protein
MFLVCTFFTHCQDGKDTCLTRVQVAWPTIWLTTAAMLVVGVGAALHLLSVAPHILQQLAEENVVPGFQRCRLHAVNTYDNQSRC